MPRRPNAAATPADPLADRIAHALNLTNGTMPLLVIVSDDGTKVRAEDLARGHPHRELVEILTESERDERLAAKRRSR